MSKKYARERDSREEGRSLILKGNDSLRVGWEDEGEVRKGTFLPRGGEISRRPGKIREEFYGWFRGDVYSFRVW